MCVDIHNTKKGNSINDSIDEEMWNGGRTWITNNQKFSFFPSIIEWLFSKFLSWGDKKKINTYRDSITPIMKKKEVLLFFVLFEKEKKVLIESNIKRGFHQQQQQQRPLPQ